MNTITVMIAEDLKMIMDLVSEALMNESKKIQVIGKAENGKVLIDMVSMNVPDVVILDLNMPIMDGYKVLEVFAKEYPGIKTIILSEKHSDYHVATAITQGVAGYIDKGGLFSELVKAIESVMIEGFYFNKFVSKEIIMQLKNERKLQIGGVKLTEQEVEILLLLCKDMTFAQIGFEMNVSPRTIEYHVNKLLYKTNSTSKTSLIIYAIKNLIVRVEDL